ncbi:MAG: NADH-quinone oxidoreductase subunit M [Halobacteriovoraceae bacterium]|nr:NADH-quinone oxidoreductase subunit M [Halobacteriovoraceae bacterium]
MLNLILWLPVVGMIGVLVTPKGKDQLVRYISLGATALTFIVTILLYLRFDESNPNVQQVFQVPWIEQFHINYALGIDGISLPMILLTGLLFFICILSSWTITKSVKAYFALLLMLESSVFGVFMSLDFFLFYVYWEVMLLPMFFLIGIWGGENREYAAVKFFLYTFFGSIVMLVGIIALYYATGKGPDSFSILALQGGHFTDMTVNVFGTDFSFEKLFFWSMFLGFAIKVPIFPFHTWLPHAHVQAPTAVSVILAGVLLKMGTYGFLRIAFPIFPSAAVEYSTAIAILGVISVIYGAFCAMAQNDVKKLVAYSSVSHMGFVMMGLAAMTIQGMNGAVLQMFNHGTSTAMMFLMIGVIYERSHHRWIVRPDGTKGYGGIAAHLPRYTVVFIIGMFASLGLPGLSGFISEALIFLGIYQRFTTITVIAVLGLLIGAAYLLWMYKRMFFGEPSDEVKSYSDMNAREVFYMVPLCIAVIVFGVYPAPILNIMKSSVGQLVELMAQFQ